jgi:hypothetical protein
MYLVSHALSLGKNPDEFLFETGLWISIGS